MQRGSRYSEMLRAARRGGSGVLLDSNVLLLLLVGLLDRDLVPEFDKTDTFTPEDYDALFMLVNYVNWVIVTTPNIVTEVSNLINTGSFYGRWLDALFALFAERIVLMREESVPSATAARQPVFVKFGITDTVIMEIAARRLVVITVDLNLAVYLESRGDNVINFRNLQPANWSGLLSL